jgi:site-specific recombinase XerD
LYTSKTLKNGEHPIMLRIIKDRKPKYMKVGYSCHIDLWDAKNNCPKNKHPNKLLLDTVIAQKKIEAQRLLLEFDSENIDYTLNDVKRKLKGTRKDVSVLKFIDELIGGFKTSNQNGNASVYTDLMRSIKKYNNDKDLNFPEITYSFLKKYEQALRANDAMETSISYYMRTLRSVFNKAILEGVCKKVYYPFNDYEVSALSTETRKRAISKENIHKIIAAELKEERLINARNYFLFSFYCGGINFTDIARLKWSNIHEGRISYARAKGGKLYSFKLVEPAANILAFYKNNFYQGSDGYIFPILYKRHISDITIRNRIHKIIGQVNKDLKQIAAAVKIDCDITTYTARHSMATVLKNSGVAKSIISECLGHNSEHTTNIYLKSFENDIIDDAFNKLL